MRFFQRIHHCRLTDQLVWRGMTVAALAIGIVCMVLAPFLFSRIADATSANRDAICSVGDLVVVGQGEDAGRVRGAVGHLRAELNFLTNIREAECPYIESHPNVGMQIDAAIHALEAELEER